MLLHRIKDAINGKDLHILILVILIRASLKVNSMKQIFSI